ncbi:PDZ domain-containing protein [Bacillaceae bacterium SIJ1]|uniref:S1C family serine protease n=1 Tax=Litoribacterium kuwaitense TaxID=1398745 RepID=UPI0013EBC089|nr:trypsin-like peptidase domain-containing protein [Litoribacterium kuwaitense]NGP45226.1 PDZ domain-containing protein [Litoribacterium kuwaitense]
MGYDNGDANYPPRRLRNRRSSTIWAALLGVIVGAAIVLSALPFLANTDLLAFEDEDKVASLEQRPQETQSLEPLQTRNVSVNVDTDVTEVVKNVQHAVVGVINLMGGTYWEPNVATEAGTGSGVIYKKEGDHAYIVTNYHVIEQASEVEVSLHDGTRIPATVLGEDIFTDLAVLYIEGSEVNQLVDTVGAFGNSEDVNVGEPVIAIGNPLGLEFSGSVTQGIISGKERAIPVDLDNDGSADWLADVMQTDAAINPGNSGGALFNLDGQVIGINSMKIAQSAVEGLGFSIPTNTVIPVISDLEGEGRVIRPVMGILSPQPLATVDSYHRRETLGLPAEVSSGVVVTEVSPDTPAASAGLQQLDVITALDERTINDTIDLRKYLYNEKRVGDAIDVTFYRGGQQQTVTLTLVTDES